MWNDKLSECCVAAAEDQGSGGGLHLHQLELHVDARFLGRQRLKLSLKQSTMFTLDHVYKKSLTAAKRFTLQPTAEQLLVRNVYVYERAPSDDLAPVRLRLEWCCKINLNDSSFCAFPIFGNFAKNLYIKFVQKLCFLRRKLCCCCELVMGEGEERRLWKGLKPPAENDVVYVGGDGGIGGSSSSRRSYFMRGVIWSKQKQDRS